MELEFEVCPQVFDRIHIGGIWQPGHDGKPMLLCCILKEFHCFFHYMWTGIVLLEYDIRYVICIESVDKREEYICEYVNIDLCIYCSINEGNRTEIFTKASPNQL